jgi:hypothetical protein
MQRVVGITGEVDHPSALALTVVDATSPRLEIAAGPREGADLTTSPPAPPHQQKHRAVAQPITPAEAVDERICGHRLGKTLGDEHMMPAPMKRLLSDQPPLGSEAKAAVHDAPEVIERRGGKALAMGGETPGLHIGGRGGRQILIDLLYLRF